MKFIIAVIKPSKLDDVRESLALLGIDGMTVTEVRGYGRQKGHTEIYRGAEYQSHFVAKCKIEVAVAEALADRAVEAIHQSAHSGKIGDGKIFVLDLLNALRVRTGETGEIAL